MKKTAFILSLSLLAGTALSACTKNVVSDEISESLASAAWMKERHIPAGPFALTAFERMHKTNAEATLYIEGDGKAWVSRKRPSLDPTPDNPVGLHLATRDSGENVVYLARPCQYSKLVDKDKACDFKYWTNKRYAPEVIDAYNVALDEIKKRYSITGFNLVGYSGGGTMAGILAGQREDVLTLRTVAGNMDHKFHSAHHRISPLEGSINPPDLAGRLANIPQIHFVGGHDEVVPPGVAQSYMQSLPPHNCARIELVQEATHNYGWIEKWPTLVRMNPACPDDTANPSPLVDLEPMDEPPRITRDSPEKP